MRKNKILSTLVGTACLLGSSALLTSCSSDDNPGNGQEDEKATRASVTYTLTFDQKTLDFADVNITYSDGNGNEATEKVDKTEWTKTVTSSSLPATFNLKTTMTFKGQPDASKTYDIIGSAKYTYSTMTASNKKLTERASSSRSIASKGVKSDNIVAALERVASGQYCYNFIVKADGTTE